MKITLAFTIFNKEEWIESLLESWLSNLSWKNTYEVVIVFDDLKDSSDEKAEKYLRKTDVPYKFLYADNKYEIFCNNLALENATGDYIVFIQDDNWIYDKNWDSLLVDVVNSIPNIGAIGFLAGLKIIPNSILDIFKWNIKRTFKKFGILKKELFPPVRYERIEINRKHKGENFSSNKIKKRYSLGIWQVHAVNRPFSIQRELLLRYGGLDRDFMPTCGDDLSLSIKLLFDGKINIYIPFDLVNLAYSEKKTSKEYNQKIYNKAYFKIYKKYKRILNSNFFNRKEIKMLYTLKIKNSELQLNNR